jgi:hypothetical protein
MPLELFTLERLIPTAACIPFTGTPTIDQTCRQGFRRAARVGVDNMALLDTSINDHLCGFPALD